MNGRSITMILIALALLVPGIGAVITYQLMEAPEESDETSVDTAPLTQQLSTLAHASISSMEESTLEEIETELSRNVGLWVSTSRITLEDHRITVLSSRVEARQVDLQVKVPVPPASLEGDLGRLITNSLMHGGTGTLPLLPGIRTDTEVKVLIEPLGGTDSFEETLRFSTEVVDPERGLLKLIQLLESDMNGHGSGMARDMEYMLNTLARYRSNNDFGDKSYQSDLNVLNEGDVEIAFNIALALRMTRWTGQVPENLVDAIDAFFKDQYPDSTMNPTGFRFWGQAEINNFNSFYLGNTGTGTRRSIGDIIKGAVEVGHADSADILSRYLSMDREYQVNMNPLDMASALSEEGLLNPRSMSDKTDTVSLTHHPSYPDPDGILVLPREEYLPDEEAQAPALVPKLVPITDYMVIGKDVRMEDFDRVDAWFTNANNSKTLSDLINTAQDSGGTLNRCGSIPPPPKPADHDFRLEWNFELHGLFDVEATYEGYGGNAPIDRDSITRTVNFRFPVRVHTWFPGRPVNDMAYDFVNINAGKLFWDDLKTGWMITGEANATEFFEDQVHPELKEGFSSLIGLLKVVEWYQQVPVIDEGSVRKLVHALTMSTELQLSNWARKGLYQLATDHFWEYYIEGPGIHPEDLRKVWIEGQHLSFQYSELKDVLHITSSLPEGSVKLSLYGMRIGTYRVDAQITTAKGLVIDIRPYSDEYSIRGDIGEHYVNEGPLYRNVPDQSVSSLLIEGGWTISTPAIEVQPWDAPSPYLLANGFADELNMTISFILSGDARVEPGELLDDIQDLIRIPDSFGEAQVSILLGELASLSIREDIYFGIRTTSKGSGTTHPYSRTLLIRLDPEIAWSDGGSEEMAYAKLTSSGRLNCIVRDMIWGASVDPVLEGFGEIETIFLEEVPSWTTSRPMIEANNLIFSLYTETSGGSDGGYGSIQILNIVSDDDAPGDLYNPKGTEWSLMTFRGLSVLW
ncbi:MAG: hypothetical protein ACMUHY_06840 [Thermoplasmatota archaeon]